MNSNKKKGNITVLIFNHKKTNKNKYWKENLEMYEPALIAPKKLLFLEPTDEYPKIFSPNIFETQYQLIKYLIKIHCI